MTRYFGFDPSDDLIVEAGDESNVQMVRWAKRSDSAPHLLGSRSVSELTA